MLTQASKRQIVVVNDAGDPIFSPLSRQRLRRGIITFSLHLLVLRGGHLSFFLIEQNKIIYRLQRDTAN